MASQKVDTGLGNDPEKDGEGATNPARRLFLFKRPLDGSGSGSTGVDDSETGGGNEQNAGNQGLELSLPRILDTFHILCHIGVIVIDEDVYTDTNLTALQKMATGLVYEHAGPEMGSSQAATGIRVDEAVIRTFTALEFIGYTSRTNGQLDVLRKPLVCFLLYMSFRLRVLSAGSAQGGQESRLCSCVSHPLLELSRYCYSIRSGSIGRSRWLDTTACKALRIREDQREECTESRYAFWRPVGFQRALHLPRWSHVGPRLRRSNRLRCGGPGCWCTCGSRDSGNNSGRRDEQNQS
ncbi:hypothetical protein BJY00DRAFT_287075 [Aspergillus carlsbadensis]|nr:hypothetical protein BJY00DRAFT_287075 [Aspergillus carlsbadensis]